MCWQWVDRLTDTWAAQGKSKEGITIKSLRFYLLFGGGKQQRENIFLVFLKTSKEIFAEKQFSFDKKKKENVFFLYSNGNYR